ncbi:MAG: cytidylate kinase-like family protein [Dysgonamonadaceae bacterium]|jgi:cytidylate kinase|nr:cytidylate kinase-like family protein [Dysgonamonadaceae bacterium]
MEKYIITIGRQLGSGGKIIGEKLAQKLNIACYDKELINIASKESGLGTEFFEKADEKSNFNALDSYFGFRTGYMGNGSVNCLCNETLFKIQSDVIRNIAGRESCIIVGRCADYILRESNRLLRIFISANDNDRTKRLADSKNITEKEASVMIEHADKKRAAYYNYYSNKEWGNAASYDLCLNSSTLGIDLCVEMLEKCAGNIFRF